MAFNANQTWKPVIMGPSLFTIARMLDHVHGLDGLSSVRVSTGTNVNVLAANLTQENATTPSTKPRRRVLRAPTALRMRCSNHQTRVTRHSKWMKRYEMSYHLNKANTYRYQCGRGVRWRHRDVDLHRSPCSKSAAHTPDIAWWPH